MGNPDIQTKERKKTLYENYFKRPLDLICALLAITILSPIMIIIAILVKIKLGSPIIFKQRRIGYGNKPFFIYKFRSMTNEKDAKGNLLPDKVRLNNFGKKLRQTSLDELPSLFNIVKGDISIVGPRPLIERYLPYYTSEEIKRHEVKPGLTGLAQVNGRSFISWEEIFQYDLKYLNNISFKNDIRIVWQTFWKVLQRKDIADMSAIKKISSGQLVYHQKGKLKTLHQPLDVERKDSLYEIDRNR